MAKRQENQELTSTPYERVFGQAGSGLAGGLERNGDVSPTVLTVLHADQLEGVGRLARNR